MNDVVRVIWVGVSMKFLQNLSLNLCESFEDRNFANEILSLSLRDLSIQKLNIILFSLSFFLFLSFHLIIKFNKVVTFFVRLQTILKLSC